MIKIGIAGETGAGKSSFAKFMSLELPNSVVINGDIWMKKFFSVYSEELESLFGKLECDINGRIYSRNFTKTKEHVLNTLRIISPSMNDEIMCEISTLSYDVKFVIVEWSFLSYLPVWNTMEYKFVIEADKNLRINRLLLRDSRNDLENDIKRIQNKVEATKIYSDIKDTIVICNNETEDFLKQKAFYYAKSIEEKI